MGKEKSFAATAPVLVHIGTYPLQLARKAMEREKKEAKHSDKWDSCVADVQKGGQDVDPYAVCTSSLGDQSFEALKKGGSLPFKVNCAKCEADSGSAFPAQLRAKTKK